MPEPWDFWLDELPHSPAFNMAADEALLLTANIRSRPVLRFYQWNTKAVSIGYVQKLAAAPKGYEAVRRPTGGGVVFHDYDFTYTVACPADHWISNLDRIQSYDCLNSAVRDALLNVELPVDLSAQSIPHSVDRLTMVCFTNPTRYDLMLQGRKVGGSAQRRTRDGLLHQASLHFGGPLPVDRSILGNAIIKAFQQHLKTDFQAFAPSEDFLATVQHLVDDKYATREWNERR